MRDVPLARTDASRERYEAFDAKVRWCVPDTFRFGSDVVDEPAQGADGAALIRVNAERATRTVPFDGIARAAAALPRLGVAKGDGMVVTRPRRPDWMVAVGGAVKTGAVPIPCIEIAGAERSA